MLEGANWRHLCIDMQRMFAEDTPWHVDWMERILPQVHEVARRFADKTIFTRFVPPANHEKTVGAWREYYVKWWMMTREHLRDEMVDILPSLQTLVPPAQIFDKPTYSPWADGRLHSLLRTDQVTTVVLTGGETDVCVLAAVMGAIDLGYYIIVLSDGVCSGSDDTHDAALKLLADRFALQLRVCTTQEFLRAV